MKASFRLPVLPALFLAFHPFAARATVVPAAADATISSASPTTNFGALPTLNVGPGATALLKFDLSALPAGAVTKATLTLWVNKVAAAGALQLAPATSAWSEPSVTWNTTPTFGAPAAINVPAAQAGTWITVDVTSLVQGWVATPASNFGIAVTPDAGSPSTTVFFDSKEAVATSHAATLDVAVTPAPVSLAYGYFSSTATQLVGPLNVVFLPSTGVNSGLVPFLTSVLVPSAGIYLVEFEVNATTSGRSFGITVNGVLAPESPLATAAGATVSHTFLVAANAFDQLSVVNSDISVVSVNSASLTIRQIQ